MHCLRIVLAASVALIGCSRPLQTARTTPSAPPAEKELEAEQEMLKRRCSPYWAFLFPGMGQICLRQEDKGGALLTLGVAELGTSLAVARRVDDNSHPGSVLPALAFQDLWVYGIADAYLTRQLAARKLYVPQDSIGDLVLAPFNSEVMSRPAVWGGLAALLAVGIGVSLVLEDDINTDEVGDDPNVLGHEFHPAAGYPLGFALGAGLFTHVAVAEEALFRGLFQSSLARMGGETMGWLAGSFLFGLAHAPNALALEGEDRKRYLMYGVPVITVLGSYMGYVYKESDYSLAPPVALHFWYDLLLTTTFFVLEPKRSPLSAGIRFNF